MTKFKKRALIVLSGATMVAGVSALAACGAKTNTINFYADGVLVQSLSLEAAEEGAKLPAVPEKAGYTGAWETYELGETDVTVNAVYTPITYTISFVADGAVVGTSSYTVEDKDHVTVPAVPTKASYTGAWESYTLTTGDLIVGAVYTADKYTVTYVAEGVTVGTRDYTVESGDIEEPEVPTKAHYTGAWESYVPTAENITVSAVYTPIDYTITYVDEDGETVATRTYNAETAAEDFDEPAVPEKEGYIASWDEYSLTAYQDMTIEAKYEESLAFTLNEDKESYSVSGIGTFTGSDLVIPATYNGLPVTEIAASAFFSYPNTNTTLKKVTIGNNVTTINDMAFAMVTNLETVIIGDSVKTISKQAFASDTRLTSVTIGKNVETIVDYAFSMTKRLVEVINLSSLEITAGSSALGGVAAYALAVTTDPDSKVVVKDGFKFYETEDVVYLIDYVGTETELTLPADFNGKSYQIMADALYQRNMTSVVISAGVTKIGKQAFYYSQELASVTIQGETEIGEYAFRDCIKLTNIDFGNQVTTIGIRAFSNTGFTSLVIPDTVETLGQYAFEKCASLQSVTLGSGLKSIGGSLFSSCSALTEVRYKGTAEKWATSSIGNNAIGSTIFKQIKFYFNDVEFTGELVIPEGVTKITSYAFAAFPITTLSLPASLTTIADRAFNGVSTMTEVTYAGTLVQWAKISFAANANPLSVSKSAKLYVGSDKTEVTGELDLSSAETIGAYAFYGMTGITGVKLSDKLTSIGAYAFYGCTGLTSVAFPSVLETIGIYAFSGCTGLTSLEIPSSVTSIGTQAFASCTGLHSVVINGHKDEDGNAITTIGDRAFSACTNLYSVTLGEGVLSWSTGDTWQSFYQCYRLAEIINLTKTAITAGVTNTAGQYAVAVVASAADKGTVTTDNEGFVTYTAKDGKLYYINYTGTATKLVLPDNGGKDYAVKSYAFYGLSAITSVTLPVQVTEIGGAAFTSTKLTEAVYNGTVAQWAAISFGSSTATPAYVAKSLTIGGVELAGTLDLTSLETINNYAFAYLTKVTAVYVDGEIGASAFYKSTGLQLAVLGENVTKIGANAFSGCTALVAVLFENTAKGWAVTEKPTDDTTVVEPVEVTVTDLATNATNLNTTYVAMEWTYTAPKADDTTTDSGAADTANDSANN